MPNRGSLAVKARLLVVSNAYPSKQKPYAGIFVKNQVAELVIRNNYDVDIFVLKRKYTGMFGSMLKYSSAFVRFMPLIVRKYDVIHLHFFFPFIWLVLLYCLFRPKTPIVLTIHGSDIHGRFRNRLSRRLHRYAIGKVSYIQSAGEGLAKEFTSTFGRSVDLISPAGIDKRIFRKELVGKSHRRYDFIFVGSFIKGKGIDLILDAMSVMENNMISYCFIGSGVLEDDIRVATDTHDITIMTNLSQPEIAIQLNNSRFFLFPSRYESFGLVVTESLYCGIPAVVSRVGGLKGQVEDRVNGIFIKSLDAQGVASAMNSALKMTTAEYRRMSDNAMNSNGEYSLEYIVERLEGTYQMLIENRI